jgi:anti-sigma B factor antagonist
MSIEERTSNNVTVLDVGGRMTIETVGDMPLLARVHRLLQAGRTHVVVNLAGVPYVDTTGIAELVEAYVATKRQSGSLKLLHLTPHVRAVLTVTRLLTILEAYQAEADAVASFESGVT